MLVLDAGHIYELSSLDGDIPVTLRFVKRLGAGYPGNQSAYSGTNCQEVIRALIDRVKYLDGQIPCWENRLILDHLRGALTLFELRAARRHGRELPLLDAPIETSPADQSDGHIHASPSPEGKPA